MRALFRATGGEPRVTLAWLSGDDRAAIYEGNARRAYTRLGMHAGG